jgi:hypothetical protein
LGDAFGGGGTPYSKDMDFASCILWLNALEGIIGRDRRLVLLLGRMSRRIDKCDLAAAASCMPPVQFLSLLPRHV